MVGTHKQTNKCKANTHASAPPLEEVRTCLPVSNHFVIDMPRGGVGNKCPVPGCPLETNYSAPSRMRIHFNFVQMEHTTCIPQQGEVSRCQLCGLTGLSADRESHRKMKDCLGARGRYRR